MVAAVAAATTFLVPGVLNGTAVMNGSARGTALVVLVVAVPALVVSMLAAARGWVAAVIVWLGATAHLLYNGVLFLFATPFNRLFLLYCAMFALSVWTAISVLRAIDVPAFAAAQVGRALPARAIASYLWVIAALNALVWLARVVPATFNGTPPAFLEGTGLPTNPVYVQDLSFWIPLMVVSAFWLWRRRAWGYVLGGALLVWGPIESVSIAVDQAFGHTADPASTVASVAIVPVFVALALVGLVPLLFYFRNLHRQDG